MVRPRVFSLAQQKLNKKKKPLAHRSMAFVFETVFYIALFGLELTISLLQFSRITDKLQLGLTGALCGFAV